MKAKFCQVTIFRTSDYNTSTWVIFFLSKHQKSRKSFELLALHFFGQWVALTAIGLDRTVASGDSKAF